eukprot:ANDGO_03801.mRNA.1 hypothetical protein
MSGAATAAAVKEKISREVRQLSDVERAFVRECRLRFIEVLNERPLQQIYAKGQAARGVDDDNRVAGIKQVLEEYATKISEYPNLDDDYLRMSLSNKYKEWKRDQVENLLRMQTGGGGADSLNSGNDGADDGKPPSSVKSDLVSPKNGMQQLESANGERTAPANVSTAATKKKRVSGISASASSSSIASMVGPLFVAPNAAFVSLSDSTASDSAGGISVQAPNSLSQEQQLSPQTQNAGDSAAASGTAMNSIGTSQSGIPTASGPTSVPPAATPTASASASSSTSSSTLQTVSSNSAGSSTMLSDPRFSFLQAFRPAAAAAIGSSAVLEVKLSESRVADHEFAVQEAARQRKRRMEQIPEIRDRRRKRFKIRESEAGSTFSARFRDLDSGVVRMHKLDVDSSMPVHEMCNHLQDYFAEEKIRVDAVVGLSIVHSGVQNVWVDPEARMKDVISETDCAFVLNKSDYLIQPIPKYDVTYSRATVNSVLLRCANELAVPVPAGADVMTTLSGGVSMIDDSEETELDEETLVRRLGPELAGIRTCMLANSLLIAGTEAAENTGLGRFCFSPHVDPRISLTYSSEVIHPHAFSLFPLWYPTSSSFQRIGLYYGLDDLSAFSKMTSLCSVIPSVSIFPGLRMLSVTLTPLNYCAGLSLILRDLSSKSTDSLVEAASLKDVQSSQISLLANQSSLAGESFSDLVTSKVTGLKSESVLRKVTILRFTEEEMKSLDVKSLAVSWQWDIIVILVTIPDRSTLDMFVFMSVDLFSRCSSEFSGSTQVPVHSLPDRISSGSSLSQQSLQAWRAAAEFVESDVRIRMKMAQHVGMCQQVHFFHAPAKTRVPFTPLDALQRLVMPASFSLLAQVDDSSDPSAYFDIRQTQLAVNLMRSGKHQLIPVSRVYTPSRPIFQHSDVDLNAFEPLSCSRQRSVGLGAAFGYVSEQYPEVPPNNKFQSDIYIFCNGDALDLVPIMYWCTSCVRSRLSTRCTILFPAQSDPALSSLRSILNCMDAENRRLTGVCSYILRESLSLFDTQKQMFTAKAGKVSVYYESDSVFALSFVCEPRT